MARPRVAPYGFGYLRPGRSDGGGPSPATRSSWSSSLFASQSMGEPTSRDGSVLGVSSDVNKAMSTMMQVLLLARFVAPRKRPTLTPTSLFSGDHGLG
jgi:hypothetical protein